MVSRVFLILWLFAIYQGQGQSFRFAHVTDTHVGGSTGAEDLRRTVRDLNQLQDIDFVILSGDVTEFGSDEELKLAKQILDSLQLPLYVLPGNHDSNWSESGANSFRRVFGSETFFFEHQGFQFVGTASGPNLRMGPGQIPRENLVWMDSVFDAHPDGSKPLIAVNHYPLDSSLNNWYEKIDRLKSRNIQLALCGHGHQNKGYDWEGITGVMGRSNLRAKEEYGGYNLVTVTRDSAFFQVRQPGVSTEECWLKVPLMSPAQQTSAPKRPDYGGNEATGERVIWEYQDHSDIGAGMSTDGNYIFVANTVGEIYALDRHTGKRMWTFRTGGKIYSTPHVHKGVVVAGSYDHFIYGLEAKTGEMRWRVAGTKAVLGSPTIQNGKAYIGDSSGVFRCLRVLDGEELWRFEQVSGFVSTSPTVAGNQVLFGSWDNGFYALDTETGMLNWEWNNGHTNRMFSPAACYPVVVEDRVFIVAPDRYMTVLDLKSGEEIWRKQGGEHRFRESIGLSSNGKRVYAKTMDGNLIGVSVFSGDLLIDWESELQLPYEIAPTNMVAKDSLVYVPSHSGMLSAVDENKGKVVWQYKISNAMINPVLVLRDKIIASTMDGKIVCFRTAVN